MLQQELLISVLKALNKSHISYMVTGSIVSSIQGEPRLTHDIDIVITITKDKVSELIESFPPPRYYLDQEAANDAIEHFSMFNMIDSIQGDKVDFWLLTDDDFDKSRFARKQCIVFRDTEMYVSAPEDTILAKLNWAKASGGSIKQFTDAVRVYELHYAHLDFSYIEAWTKKLGLTELWKEIKEQANPI
jgi:hypothetical protein